jgi:hypothetical protein
LDHRTGKPGANTIITVRHRYLPLRTRPIAALFATCILLSACGGSSASKTEKLNEPVTPSIKPVDLGKGKGNPACQLLSRVGAAQVLGIQFPAGLRPDTTPAGDGITTGPTEEIPDCFLGEAIALELTDDTLEPGGCIFRPIDEVRLSGHVACLEYDENLPNEPDYSVEVSISYGKWTDATLDLSDHKRDHATVRKQLIQLGTNLIAATH